MSYSDRLTSLFNIEFPLILAPMAGAADASMAISVAKAGGLGSIACAMLDEEKIRSEVGAFRREAPGKPLNLNFFCHQNIPLTKEAEQLWIKTLGPYYKEFGVSSENLPVAERRPFDEKTCLLLEELKPEVVSFHFGLPSLEHRERLKRIGCKIISSATTLKEAVWLEENGCDAVIAQGIEAGGHRAMFLDSDVASQIGTMALIPLIADRIKIPVIASGGIADGRGIAAAMILGASAVQIGSAFLLTKEAKISTAHREALLSNANEETVITNLFSGRPARSIKNRIIRELGALSSKAPPFPHAGGALNPLKNADSRNFASLWSGQAIGLRKKIVSAEELAKEFMGETQKILGALAFKL